MRLRGREAALRPETPGGQACLTPPGRSWRALGGLPGCFERPARPRGPRTEADAPALFHNEQKRPFSSTDHVPSVLMSAFDVAGGSVGGEELSRAVAVDEASSGDSGRYLLWWRRCAVFSGPRFLSTLWSSCRGPARGEGRWARAEGVRDRQRCCHTARARRRHLRSLPALLFTGGPLVSETLPALEATRRRGFRVMPRF